MNETKKIQIGGDHYLDMGLQPWDALEAWQTDNEYIGYQVGSAVSYLARWRRKGGFNDVKKAHHHLSRLIEWYSDNAQKKLDNLIYDEQSEIDTELLIGD